MCTLSNGEYLLIFIFVGILIFIDFATRRSMRKRYMKDSGIERKRSIVEMEASDGE